MPSVLADEISVGVGLGSLYSGLGANISKRSDSDIQYLSYGCASYSTIYGSACGLGLGWVSTDIFDFQTPKHGLGLYFGVVGGENKDFDNKPVYGAGIGYHYFFHGVHSAGANVGLTVVSEGSDTAAMFQIGYQF
jgi:hypothetical protein